jgi:SRSO17 transposase
MLLAPLQREGDMGERALRGSAERFAHYLDGLVSVIGHAARARPLRDYCTGLLLPCERKSVEPIAAVTAPQRVAAQHQALLHFVAEGAWSDAAVLAKVREIVLPQIERHGAIAAWIIDDTAFAKHGRHSVGVTHQYCGELGKQANCQAAVSLSIANAHASLPVAYRLYLPKSWAEDNKRRTKAGVPEEIVFQTKPKIALDQLTWACAANLPRGVVLMDSAYGTDAALRRGARALGLDYAAAVYARTLVEAGNGKMTAGDLALGLPQRAWHTITWRQGAAEALRSRFARVRVRARGEGCTSSEPEEWLLIEWPKGEKAPAKYWLSTLPSNIAFDRLVAITMMRWRIERDYQDLKQEVGLGHFEGRGWRGFHHHASLCIAAYGFLISERSAIPPSQTCSARFLPQPALPEGWRPRGAAAAA